MDKDFFSKDWKEYIPKPIYDECFYYNELYQKTWNIARTHVKDVKGMYFPIISTIPPSGKPATSLYTREA